MSPRLFSCNAQQYGVSNLVPFNADWDSCMKISLDCSSAILISDVQTWCSDATVGDRKVFGETLIVALATVMP